MVTARGLQVAIFARFFCEVPSPGVAASMLLTRLTTVQVAAEISYGLQVVPLAIQVMNAVANACIGSRNGGEGEQDAHVASVELAT